MYVCMYVCMYVSIYIHVFVFIICTHVYSYSHVCICVCIYVCVYDLLEPVCGLQTDFCFGEVEQRHSFLYLKKCLKQKYVQGTTNQPRL